MRSKFIATSVVVVLLMVTLFYGASGRSYWYASPSESATSNVAPQSNTSGARRMVDMIADDSYLIERGDSTIFILVGNFAAHHNGAVILADSAVRYSNQSFECFGNVLINQNSTYAYGDRAEYNRNNSTATIYSDLVKVVDGEAVMYTYHCTFDTATEIGHFHGGCYVEKGASLMESDRGYYYTDTHELIAVDNVEMRDETYQMTGDSVIFNTQTEDARYFTNTNIWNDKDEYLFANEGYYTKSTDTHRLTRDAYILSPEREIWSDSIEYCRANGHIIGRGNIQVDDTTQKVLGFADYGEWWDEPGNALFTRRPSMINYDPAQPDSLFLAADTMWLYTISAVPAPAVAADSLSTADVDVAPEETPTVETPTDADATEDAEDAVTEDVVTEDVADTETPSEEPTQSPAERPTEQPSEHPTEQPAELPTEQPAERPTERSTSLREPAPRADADTTAIQSASDVADAADTTDTADTTAVDSSATSTTDSLASERVTYTAKEVKRRTRDSLRTAERTIRDSLRTMRRAERDSIRAYERAVRDSLRAIRQAELDSIRYIRDSLLDIKLDTIIAQRIARSSRIADEEAARIERIRLKAEERRHRQIDRAKARAARRGREYTGEDYVRDSVASDTTLRDSMSLDSLAQERGQRDSLMRDSLMCDSLMRDSVAMDSLAADSLATDSLPSGEPQIPADSVYKMIKAYRNVRMYRSDTQVVCDSMLVLNTDSVIRLYIEPVMWNENNQITADSMAIYTRNQLMERAHFMGDPIMGSEIDTTYYNQVKGKDMISYFSEGQVYRNDVNTNAQTIYYMQEEEGDMAVTGLMYIESATMSFYLTDGEIDQIVYRQNPEYVIYPLAMIPATQQLRLDGFEWHYDRRPARDSVFDRQIRPTRREHSSTQARPRFRITERINYDRRRLTENRMWVDRLDVLSPEVVEWRNSRPSYQNRE